MKTRLLLIITLVTSIMIPTSFAQESISCHFGDESTRLDNIFEKDLAVKEFLKKHPNSTRLVTIENVDPPSGNLKFTAANNSETEILTVRFYQNENGCYRPSDYNYSYDDGIIDASITNSLSNFTEIINLIKSDEKKIEDFYPINCNPLKLDYIVKGDSRAHFCKIDDSGSIVMSLQGHVGGPVEIQIPYKVMDALFYNCLESSGYFVLVNGEEVNFDWTDNDNEGRYSITVDLPPGYNKVEIMRTFQMNLTQEGFCGSIWNEHERYLPPSLQKRIGVEPQMIKCNDNLVLASKYDASTICVKPESISKLTERSWLQTKQVIPEQTQHNERVHSHVSENIEYHYGTHKDGLPEITVNSIAFAIFDMCKRDDDCTIQKLQDISRTENKTAVLGAIDELVSIYEDGEFYCHPNAHHVGEFLLGYVHGNFSETIPYVDSRCAAGVMHGLVENTISLQTLLYDKSIPEVDIVSPCNEIEQAINYNAKMECIHGMGHSLAKAYDYDVLKATKNCHIYQDYTERFMCQGGLFMENINKYWDDKTGDFDDNDPYYPCNNLTDRQASLLCYRYQALYFLDTHNFEPQIAFAMCDDIGDQEFAEYCYKGTSTHMASRYFANIEDTVYMCINVRKEMQPVCVKGAIESITRFVSVDLGDDFCYMLPDDLEGKCFERKNQLEESVF